MRAFMVGGDEAAANRPVREPPAPALLPEVVQRLFVIALDHGAREIALGSALCAALCSKELLSPELVSSEPVLPPEVDPSAVGAGSLAHAVARRIATARRG